MKTERRNTKQNTAEMSLINNNEDDILRDTISRY